VHEFCPPARHSTQLGVSRPAGQTSGPRCSANKISERRLIAGETGSVLRIQRQRFSPSARPSSPHRWHRPLSPLPRPLHSRTGGTTLIACVPPDIHSSGLPGSLSWTRSEPFLANADCPGMARVDADGRLTKVDAEEAAIRARLGLPGDGGVRLRASASSAGLRLSTWDLRTAKFSLGNNAPTAPREMGRHTLTFRSP
jgi:hypothetical protein